MDWSALLIASVLFVLASGALVAEVFFVSFGALALVSLGLAIASVIYAFSASNTLGWGFVVAAPVIGGVILRQSLLALAHSPLIPRTAIDDDAGVHHHATQVGAIPGALGTLVTAARPTGRARFAHGEIDVQCDRSAERGESIVVQRSAGATVFVTLAPPSSPLS